MKRLRRFLHRLRDTLTGAHRDDEFADEVESGVLAYFVGQRRQEIGIRLALGASRSGVVWLVVRQGALLAVVGVGIGMSGSFALSGALSGLLFGVSQTDLWTFSVIPALLFLVVLAASYLPARTAASVEPMIALRTE